jgi:hypothetical protein
MKKRFVLDVKNLYKHFNHELAKHDEKSIKLYREHAQKKLNNQLYETIVLTGPAPNWLYCAIQDVVRDFCDVLMINTPRTGDVIIFDHRYDGIPTLTGLDGEVNM